VRKSKNDNTNPAISKLAKMNFTNNDLKEAKDIAKMLLKIEKSNSLNLVELTQDIYAKQPFFLAVMRGYSLDMTDEEYQEIFLIHLLIWEYFKSKGEIPSKKITEQEFEKIQMRHIQMLKYTEGESNKAEVAKIYAADLNKIQSKALFTAVLYSFDTRPSLIKIDQKMKAIVLIGVKTFIECFENNR
jgi:hypothetical protein